MCFYMYTIKIHTEVCLNVLYRRCTTIVMAYTANGIYTGKSSKTNQSYCV